MRWYLEGPLESDCHEDRALMNRISALIKDTRDCSLTPSPMWGYRGNSAVCDPEEASARSSAMLAPWSQTSRLQHCEEKCLLFISHLVYGILLCQTSFKHRWINQTKFSSVIEIKGSYIFEHLNFVIKNSYLLHYTALFPCRCHVKNKNKMKYKVKRKLQITL